MKYKFAASFGHQKLKGFQLPGALPNDLLTSALPLDSARASPPNRCYRLTLRSLAMRVHPTLFDLASPLAGSPTVHGMLGGRSLHAVGCTDVLQDVADHDDVIVTTLSTMGYTSVASVFR